MSQDSRALVLSLVALGYVDEPIVVDVSMPLLHESHRFLLGRYDRRVLSVGTKLFRTHHGAIQKLVRLEQSSHNPPFEEPEKFDRVLIDEVLPMAMRDQGVEFILPRIGVGTSAMGAVLGLVCGVIFPSSRNSKTLAPAYGVSSL